MHGSIPVTPLQFGIAVVAVLLFAAAVIAKRIRMAAAGGGASATSRMSVLGILLQTLAFFLAGIGMVWMAAPTRAPLTIALTFLVAVSGLGAVALFISSAHALGTNWSIVACTRSDHRLVRHGPFARVRHPIYLAMLLLLICIGLGWGHLLGLAVAIPVFVAGTAIRICEEERLLRSQFGDDYADYARTTPAFIPRLR